MEKRLSEVEKAIIRIDGRFDRMSDKLDVIAGSVSNYKWQLVAAVIAIALAVVGTSIAIQQMTVSTFQAAAQSNEPKPSSQPIVVVVPTAATPSVTQQPSPAGSAAR